MLMHGEINVLFGVYRRSDYGHCTVYTYLALLFNKCTCIHCDPRDLDYTLDMGPFSNTGDTYFRVGLLGSSGTARGGEGPYIEQNLKDSTLVTTLGIIGLFLLSSCRSQQPTKKKRRRRR